MKGVSNYKGDVVNFDVANTNNDDNDNETMNEGNLYLEDLKFTRH